jgi:hypothetical protein
VLTGVWGCNLGKHPPWTLVTEKYMYCVSFHIAWKRSPVGLRVDNNTTDHAILDPGGPVKVARSHGVPESSQSGQTSGFRTAQ